MTTPPSRFGGIDRLYGAGALDRLASAHVCVVGLGGVGSWTVEALARSGIGRLTLIDPDDVCETNINRQILALDSTIGRGKGDVLKERIRDIHPGCDVRIIPNFYRRDSSEVCLDETFDYVIDAIDGVMPKAHLIATCVEKGLPIVTTGGSGGRRDPLKITVRDLSRTSNDPLLAFVRKKLRRVFGFPPPGKKFHVPCVCSDELPYIPPACNHAEAANPDDEEFTGEGMRINCDNGLGAATFITGAFGFMAAARVVNGIVQAKACQ